MRSQFRFPFPRRPHQLICLAMATLLLCLWLPPMVTSAKASVGITQAQTGRTLDQQGRDAYAAGQYEAAAAAFQQAIAQYQTTGQSVLAALALANLSLSQQQLGQWTEAETSIDAAVELLPTGVDAPSDLWSSRGEVLFIQGQLKFSQGKYTDAIELWTQAEAAYDQAAQPRQVARVQVSRARALQAAGFYNRALTLIQTVPEMDPPDTVTVDTLRIQGDLLRLTGQRDEAQTILTKALDLAKIINLPPVISAVYNSLGVLAEAQDNPDEALAYYQDAASVAAVSNANNANAKTPSDGLSLAAQVNQLQLLVQRSDWSAVAALLPDLTTQINNQSPNRDAVYSRLTFAQIILDLRETVDQALAKGETTRTNAVDGDETLLGPEAPIEIPVIVPDTPSPTTPASQLEALPAQVSPKEALLTLVQEMPTGDAVATWLLSTYGAAQTLQDIPAQTYALTTLGRLYMQTKQWDIARQQTLTALNLAQGANLPDIEYRLQEQLCKILQNIENAPADEAIKACRAAVDTLTLLRGDIAAKAADTAFDAQKVESAYRNLIDLLLKDTADENNIKEARKVLESLQLAELDNFFREACLEAQTVEIDDVVDEKTAVIYPIVLENRLEIILSLSGQTLHRSSPVSQADLNATIGAWVDGIPYQSIPLVSSRSKQVSDPTLNRFSPALPSRNSFSRDITPFAEQLYDWLMAPIEADLQATNVDTLVFVLDGNLRQMPMAALYDGQRYLVEKYAVALTPGLQLIDPKPIARDSIEAFLGGVAEAQNKGETGAGIDFNALPNVETELEEISKIVQGDFLLDEEVTNRALEVEIGTSTAPIVHLATHGQFGDSFDDTFIITWKGKLNVNELSQLLKTSELSRKRDLELLVLSACETAKGNDRSALGIAGVATRSGARSTLATLWQVEDASTAKLMTEFYNQLSSQSMTKAKALQQAQLKILNDPTYNGSPYYWAPFILLGNWL